MPRAAAIVSRRESYLDRGGIVYNIGRMARRFVDLSIFLERPVATSATAVSRTFIISKCRGR
jgi:hypothetical protein